MPKLFPNIQSYHSEYLDVGNGHQLYLELSGSPAGIPVLFLHGGPGAGLPSGYKQFFDPEEYLIIGFDQRGCGKSTPFASLRHNDMDHLVADIDKIRQHLGISTWLLCGGSWGGTLALVYGIRHPDVISGFILRGSYLARAEDADWFLTPSGGPANMFPEYYQRFTQQLDDISSSQAICDSYYRIFMQADELTQAQALKNWFGWEERISRLVVHYPTSIHSREFQFVKSLALLECHFLKNQCFISENYILNNIHVLADIPATIIHGRYDMICKAESAFSLHKQWRNSELIIVPDAGHSTSEIGIQQAIVQAANKFAKFLQRPA